MNLKKNIYIGAITNKPYAFKNRPWELNSIYSIDILDSLGSNLIIYLYGTDIRRILPLKNDKINEDWISNRSRFFFEGLLKWRLNIPLLQKNKKYIYISWIQSFYFFFLKIWFYSVFFKSKTLGLVLNFILDVELIITTKILMYLMGFNIIKNNNINYINDYYLFYINPFFFEDLQNKKILLLLGINIRLEAPILNIKLRKKMIKENIVYCNIGTIFNDNLNSICIGLNVKNLINFFTGKLKININIVKNLKKKIKKLNIYTLQENSLLLIGNNILLKTDNWQIYNIILKKLNIKIFEKIFNNKNFLLQKFLKINSKKKNIKKELKLNVNIIYLNLIYILYEEFFYKNIHEINDDTQYNILYIINGNYSVKNKKNKFIIYQGHLLDISIFNVDLILPNITFLEKSNKYLNIEGNLFYTNKVLTRPNFTRNDWMVLNALYIYILNILNKIFFFQLKKKKRNYLLTNRFYIHIINFKKFFKYIKKYSVNYILKELTKYSYYENKFIYIINKINITIINKIYNKILENYYYNMYNLYKLDKNAKTLKLAYYNFSQNMRNYINI